MVKQFCPPQYRIKLKGITTNNLWKPWGQNSGHSFGHNLNDQNIGRIECYAFRLRSANERPDEWGKASHRRPNKSLVCVKHAADDGNPLWLIRTIPAVSTIDGCRMNNEWDVRVCPEQQSNCRTVVNQDELAGLTLNEFSSVMQANKLDLIARGENTADDYLWCKEMRQMPEQLGPRLSRQGSTASSQRLDDL